MIFEASARCGRGNSMVSGVKPGGASFDQFSGENNLFRHFPAGKNKQQRLNELMRHGFQTIIH